jgi:hypothetical protein
LSLGNKRKSNATLSKDFLEDKWPKVAIIQRRKNWNPQI